jgi:thiopeptide-type bacteriocin biosynthesis protein
VEGSLSSGAQGRSWLSVHVPYRGSGHEFLRDSIDPFLSSRPGLELVLRHFFVRGSEGPHIRLRLEARDNAPRAALVEALDSHWGKGAMDPRTLPLEYVPYVRETARYGGELGVNIAERHFEASSRAVLSALRDGRAASYPSAMGTAIQLHIGLVGGLGMHGAEAAGFFEYASQLWSAAGWNAAHAPDPSAGVHRAQLARAFEDRLASDAGALNDFGSLLAAVRRRELDAFPGWFLDWVHSNEQVGCELGQALLNGTFVQPPFPPAPDAPSQAQNLPVRLWPILASYVHMTNNRLGILNPDEAYQAFVIARVLSGS